MSDSTQLGRTQLPLFSGGVRSPHRASQTSIAALQHATARSPKLADLVLDAVAAAGDHGLTRYELAEILSRPIQSVCRPVRELLDAGKLIERGDCRPSPYGNASRVLCVSSCSCIGGGDA